MLICLISVCRRFQRNCSYVRAISWSPWRPPCGQCSWCRCRRCRTSSTWSRRIITTDYLRRWVYIGPSLESRSLEQFVLGSVCICLWCNVCCFCPRVTSSCVELCLTCCCCRGPACRRRSSSGRAAHPITRGFSAVSRSSTASCPAHPAITPTVRATDD